MPPSLYSNPRSRSYTNISHTVIKCSNDSKKDNDNEKANSENSRTRTLPLPPKHKRRGNLPPLLRAPSQANMHHTTVPQSIVPSKLGSQHQPTRTSLRHSRMIGTGARCGSESTPLILWLSVTQLVLALLLTLSAIVRMAIAVQPMAQDWPSYTGPMVGGSQGGLALSLVLDISGVFYKLYYAALQLDSKGKEPHGRTREVECWQCTWVKGKEL